MRELEQGHTDLSNEERVRYWASRTPSERIAAGWQMTLDHYRAIGQYEDGQTMDKSIVRLRLRSEAECNNDA